VPVSGPLASGAALLGVDARSLALSGGEDYELLVTMPAGGFGRARDELQTGFGVDLSELGEVTEGSGLIGVDAEGRETVLEAAGWDHFAGG
jgi:thiamine-monophosphate kinase